MKRPLTYLVLLYATLWVLEKAYDVCLKANVNIKASYVMQKKINADVLFIGTSNTLFGIVPDVFEQQCGRTMYNLSTNHSSFAENLAHLHLYLQNNAPPRLLVIGISLSDLAISHWAFHSYLFAPFNNDSLIARLIRQNDPFYYYISYLPFAKHAYYNQYVNPFVFKGLTHILERTTTAYYWKGTYFTPTDTSGFDHFRVISQVHHHHIQYRFDNNEAQQLKALLEYAQTKDIPTLLYEPAYWKRIDQDYRGRDSAIQQLETIAGKYHAAYWTFDTLPLYGKQENFISVFHTSGEAARDFTKIFAKKLCHSQQ